jgi:threonine dehydratase
MITLSNIEAAARNLKGLILETPTIYAPALSRLAGAELYLKLENLQYTSSFKVRGAANKLASLTPEEQKRGVIAASAGNHAQGVARHASLLKIPATIVMPEGTPFTKIANTESWGATVVLKGDSYADAYHEAMSRAKRDGLTYVHAYDDPYVIAGQGTIALEMLAAVPELDALIVPIGGGGLISGIAVAAKAIKPAIKIFGVQSTAYPSMKQILLGAKIDAGEISIAEGIAVQNPGEITRDIVRELVEDIFLVDEHAIENGIHVLASYGKIVAEGAGSAGIAAVLAEPKRFAGMKLGMVICGGNIDDRLLASILLRGLMRYGRLVRLRIGLPDRPGSLAIISRIVADHNGNVLEVTHHRLAHDIPVKNVALDLLIETRDRKHAEGLIAALEEAGFPSETMSDPD